MSSGPVTRFWNLPPALFHLREQPYAGTETVVGAMRFVRFNIGGLGEILLPRNAVSPRLPAEPKNGSVCIRNGVAYQRVSDAWCAAGSTKIYTWEELHQYGNVQILHEA